MKKTNVILVQENINLYGNGYIEDILGEYKFKIVDAIITNFHLPKSTLIMLISSFGGKDFILDSYKEAIAEKYRFYSFGDSMFIY